MAAAAGHFLRSGWVENREVCCVGWLRKGLTGLTKQGEMLRHHFSHELLVSARESPAATTPGRSGEYAEYPDSSSPSKTTR
jgi:hypothetical protein